MSLAYKKQLAQQSLFQVYFKNNQGTNHKENDRSSDEKTPDFKVEYAECGKLDIMRCFQLRK
jgi:hypothetical protein